MEGHYIDMARHRLKPDYEKDANMNQLIQEVVEFFGEPYDDRYSCAYNHVSLRMVADKFNITVMKARKILITADCYSIKQSRIVNELYKKGIGVEAIMVETGLSRASVQSYLPYTKIIYNLDQKSVGADRTERWRKRVKERN